MSFFGLFAGVLFMTCFNAVGSLLFKTTMLKVKVFSLKKTFSILSLYCGILCYVAGSVLNIILMYFWDYSTVYPLTSLTCVWTLLFSKFFLGEKINGHKLLGIACIVVGAYLICL